MSPSHLGEMLSVLTRAQSLINVEPIMNNEEIKTQLILDPSSLNLESRINYNDPILPEMYRLSRDLCTAVDKRRKELLKELS